MGDVVVGIRVSEAAAALLQDPARADAVGRLVSDILRPADAASDPLAVLIAELKAEAHGAGLTDAEVDAELARHHAERRR